ncbi:unnamed protein product [Colias eurytheme]|nr:unnamed protein product [Colias eurytheme]
MDDAQGILYFTAPYRICSGKGCFNKNQNFHMVFPLYIGKKAKTKFRTIYSRDYEKVHSTRANVPFKKYPTKHIWTLPPNCSTESTVTTSTNTPTQAADDANGTTDSDEGLRPPSVKPHCPVRISKVDFGPTIPVKTFSIRNRYFGKG